MLIAAVGPVAVTALVMTARRAQQRARVAALADRPPGVEIDRRITSVTAILAAAVFVGVVAPAVGALVALAGIALTPVVRSGLRDRTERRMRQALPALLDTVAHHLRAGATVASALAEARSGNRGVDAEVARVVSRARLGLGLSAALRRWASEHDDRILGAEVQVTAAALEVAVLTGGRSASALEGLAESLRERHNVQAEARALSAQARLSAVIVGALPLVSLLSSAVLDPRIVHVVTGTSAGRTVLALGLALEAAGALAMRRLTRIEV